MKTIHNNKGFTMVELILVIMILGILSVTALPNFINITSQTHTAAVDGVLGAVREGIQLKRVENIVNGQDRYPTVAELEGADATVLFGGVLSQGIPVTSGPGGTGWAVGGAGVYNYILNADTTWTFTYDQNTGQLTRTN